MENTKVTESTNEELTPQLVAERASAQIENVKDLLMGVVVSQMIALDMDQSPDNVIRFTEHLINLGTATRVSLRSPKETKYPIYTPEQCVDVPDEE